MSGPPTYYESRFSGKAPKITSIRMRAENARDWRLFGLTLAAFTVLCVAVIWVFHGV